MSSFFYTIFFKNFLGQAPGWYKVTVLIFLFINPLVFFFITPFVAGWLLVIEFIFTLAMALKCYPLQPGGLLALEAIAIGMATPEQVKHELVANIDVLLLLIFMVAGIYFMKQILLLVFTQLLLRLQTKTTLSVVFCLSAAGLSAFLDALTVIAVIISVCLGFYSIYHKAASQADHDVSQDSHFTGLARQNLEQYRNFLCSLLMHSGVGTALGGVTTMVGEPQNLIIAHQADWSFGAFFLRMAPVTLPVLLAGLLTCFVVEKKRWLGYGATLPDSVRQVLIDADQTERQQRTPQDRARLWVQGGIALWLIVGLAFHLAAVGLIGLTVIILASAMTGVIDEHSLGKAFEEALPFTALLAVFFSVVAIIINLSLFHPLIDTVLSLKAPSVRLGLLYLVNGLLSMLSDNVFVGTVYINEVHHAWTQGVLSTEEFHQLAIAINTGTNLPSVATPNGQAAFLFLLTSPLAPLIRLSYGKMVLMALPYTVILTGVGGICVVFLTAPVTQWMLNVGWL